MDFDASPEIVGDFHLSRVTFRPVAAMRLARGYDSTAATLAHIHDAKSRSFELQIPTPDQQNESMNLIISAIVLECLAIEIVLKVRIQIVTGKLLHKHDLYDLFKMLPETNQADIVLRYAANPTPNIRPSIEDRLKFYRKTFEEWRYIYEHMNMTGSLFELRQAFQAISHDFMGIRYALQDYAKPPRVVSAIFENQADKRGPPEQARARRPLSSLYPWQSPQCQEKPPNFLIPRNRLLSPRWPTAPAGANQGLRHP